MTAVDFHPKEPIGTISKFAYIGIQLNRVLLLVLTGSKDATMLLGELEPGISI